MIHVVVSREVFRFMLNNTCNNMFNNTMFNNTHNNFKSVLIIVSRFTDNVPNGLNGIIEIESSVKHVVI